MKKKRKLSIKRITIRRLGDDEARDVVGGGKNGSEYICSFFACSDPCAPTAQKTCFCPDL